MGYNINLNINMNPEIQSLQDLIIKAKAYCLSNGSIYEVECMDHTDNIPNDQEYNIDNYAYDSWMEFTDGEGRTYLSNPDIYLETPEEQDEDVTIRRFYIDDPNDVNQLVEMGVIVCKEIA